jgi:aminopeptidase N
MFRDSWLAEGPATYAEWLWQARGESQKYLDGVIGSYYQVYIASAPIGSPTADTLLSDPVYWSGGLLLHSLRREVGDEVFFDILRTYLSRHQYSVAATSDFRDLAEVISGRDLDAFFDGWLLETEIASLP